jgi:protoheme IX farnesyltransferase
MLPVVKPLGTVAVQIILYSWAMVVSSLLLIPVANMGWTYTVVAVGTGLWFLIDAFSLYRAALAGEVKNPMRLFHSSISYLTLLFIAVALDPLLPF